MNMAYDDPRPSSPPVGTTSLAVAKDNLITLDKMLSGTDPNITNRKGQKMSLLTSGYQIVGDFADLVKVEVTRKDQVYTSRSVTHFEGALWQPSEVLPYTPTGSDPTQGDEFGKWLNVEVSELKSIARSLNVPDDAVMYGLPGETINAAKQYIFNPNNQTTYDIPAGVGAGEVVVSVVGSGLVTSGGVYTLTIVTTKNASNNVKDYGAIGDGVADDYNAIKNTLLVGGVIEFEQDKIYSVSQQLKIKSNTTLNLNGATLRRDFSTSATGSGLIGFFEDYIKNVTIQNGTLDINGTNYGSAVANGFGGNGIDNLLIKNVTITDVVDLHALDFSNWTNSVVEDCNFLGQVRISSDTEKEAIQFDPGYGDALGYGVTENITIQRCVFDGNTATGTGTFKAAIGNHSANTLGCVTKGINILNNTFNGMTYTGIRCYGWQNVTVDGNKFNDVKTGVIAQEGTGTNPISTEGLIITNNIFEDDTQITTNCVYINRKDATSITLSHNVLIDSNIFNTRGNAVRVERTNTITITNNKVDGCSALLYTFNADSILIANNTLNNTTNSQIYLSLAATNIKISNNLTMNGLGRFVHSTGIDADLRKNIDVSGNTQIDGARTFCAFDSGATAKVTINNNIITTGDNAVIPSDDLIINLGITGLSNYMSNNSISKDIMETANKTWRATNGGIATNEKVHGTPEGVVIAGVGSTVTRTDGGIGSTFYIKESGTGSTGWVAK